MRIALNLIARNCANQVVKALESVKGQVDVFVIGFAGRSDDLTREAILGWLEENHCEYVVDEFDFENFSDARNRVLALTPADCDWMIWMDADDFILGTEELREVVDECAKRGVGCIQFPYIYHRDAYGNPLAVHDRERVVRLDLGWTWIRPVHETLQASKPHEIIRLNNLTWVHEHAAGERTRGARNLALLEAYWNAHPEDVRTLSYLGHAYFSLQKWVDSIDWFLKAYDRPSNELEKWQAAVFLARSFFYMGEYETALGWCWQAVDVEPRIADPYLVAAAAYVEMGENDKAYEFYRIADDKKPPPSMLFILPNEYTFNRWCYEHRAAANIGKVDEALEICQKALRHSPGHRGFTHFSYIYGDRILAERSKKAARQLVDYLVMRGDALAANELLRYLPKNIEDDNEIVALKDRVQKTVAHVFEPEAFEHAYGSEAGEAYEGIDDSVRSVRRAALCLVHVQKYIDRSAAKGERLTIVDLGCGNGEISVQLAKMGACVTGIDSRSVGVLRAQRLAEKEGVADRTRFICSRIESIDVNDIGRHDLAVCNEVIEHVPNAGLWIGTALDLADAAVFTTPHNLIAYGPPVPPPGLRLDHIKEYSVMDLLKLVAGQGGHVKRLITDWIPVEEDNPGSGTFLFEFDRNVPTKPAVVFYTTAHAEAWTPDWLNGGGIGGSETALAQMARCFAKAGHLVFVYGPVDGVWDGVIYRRQERFVPANPAMGNQCAVFISSRTPEIFDNKIPAPLKVLWLHDWTYRYPMPGGGVYDRITKERADEIDAVFVLSEAQRRQFEKLYPFLAHKLTVIANGLDPAIFENQEPVERQRHRFIWSNSLDRGVARVAAMWPKIRKMWPDAELHIFYGLNTMLRVMHGGQHRQAGKQYLDSLLTPLEQPGITFHGRVGQAELMQEFARSQFWFYPTDFTETYCITALEAMANGCTPVTSDVAALAERIPVRLRLSEKASDARFLKLLKAVDDDIVAGVTPEEANSVRELTWQREFEHWNEIFEAWFEARYPRVNDEHNPGEPKDKTIPSGRRRRRSGR